MSTEIYPAAAEQQRPAMTYMSRSRCEEVCAQHDLAFPPEAWKALRETAADPPLVTPEPVRSIEPGALPPEASERLALTEVSNTLRGYYQGQSHPAWRGIGNQMLYTLNTLSAHFNKAEADMLPEPPVAVAERFDAPPVIDATLVTQFAGMLGIELKPSAVSSTLHRMTRAMVEQRYPAHLSLLPEGEYQADAIAFSKFDDELFANSVSAPGLAAIIHDQRILRAASVAPKVHYALLRYCAALKTHSFIEADQQATVEAPLHPSMRLGLQTPELDDNTFAELYARGALLEYGSYGDTAPERSLTAKVQRAEAAGISYPLSTLFCRYRPNGMDSTHYYLDAGRVSAFLGNTFNQDDDFVRQTLLSPSDFAELSRINACYGPPERLPQATVGVSPFDEDRVLPSYFANHVEAFADRLGHAFDSRAVYCAVAGYVSETLKTSQPQWEMGQTYIDEGRVYSLRGPAQPDVAPDIEVHSITLDVAKAALKAVGAQLRPRDSYVLWQYLKAVRQSALQTTR